MLVNLSPAKYRTIIYPNHVKHDAESTENLPGIFIESYGDPKLWAYSTLSPSFSENLVQIYEVKLNMDATKETIRQRMWLHDILDDNKIPYKIEIVGAWAGRRKFGEKQIIYVEEKNRKKSRRLIKAYNNAANFIPEDKGEENMSDDIENNLPQVKCPACGKEFDFDYVKCPFCKAKI